MSLALSARSCKGRLKSIRALRSSRQFGFVPTSRQSDRHVSAVCRAAEIEDQVGGNGFFNDAFKAALAAAVRRQDEGNRDSDEHHNSHREAPTSSSNDAMYTPVTARVEEVSASEEVLSAALQQSQANLRSFMGIARQLEAAIDREKRQVERLRFALDKCKMDSAYYKTLEALADRRN